MLTSFANVADLVDPSEAPPTTEKTPGVAGSVFSLPPPTLVRVPPLCSWCSISFLFKMQRCLRRWGGGAAPSICSLPAAASPSAVNHCR